MPARRNKHGLSEDIAMATGEWQLSADHPWSAHQFGNCSRELGGRPMSRLVVVSNRVPSPADRGVRAGGLVAALSESISGGLWFGWSGNSTRRLTCQTASKGKMDFAVRLSPADSTASTTSSPIRRYGRCSTIASAS
jgi:hypothetical protein